MHNKGHSMDVSLTPELERRIAEKVDAGLYATPGEAVREGLRLLFDADTAREARMAQLDAEIDVGLIELEQGRGLLGEPVFAALKAKIAKLRAR
jgi:antitoxin ParD1/3/4